MAKTSGKSLFWNTFAITLFIGAIVFACKMGWVAMVVFTLAWLPIYAGLIFGLLFLTGLIVLTCRGIKRIIGLSDPTVSTTGPADLGESGKHLLFDMYS
jgi:hypothetical protein